MFLLNAGRRHVQVRVVEPVVSSVNSGDCFVVVTTTDVIQWMGQFANVIERAKCSDVAQRILIKKDFGCFKAEQVDIVEEDPLNSGNRHGAGGGAYQRFWKALAAPLDASGHVIDVELNGAGSPSEDEQFESAMVATNSVYQVDLSADRLVPSETFWGGLPQFDMLQPKQVPNIYYTAAVGHLRPATSFVR